MAIVGDNMKYSVGLSGKIFSSLGENNINVKAIVQGASERNISIVVDEKEEKKAVNVIHERFFANVTKKVHLFVVGIGNVGNQFLSILEQQQAYCKAIHQIDICLVGIANSNRYLFNENGLNPSKSHDISNEGIVYAHPKELVSLLKEANLRNCITIDNTASEEISQLYSLLFNQSISVVTCNKIALSSRLDDYKQLHRIAKTKNCHFRYETTVGAALPVIKTIHDLMISGDNIHRIEAVVSGSLNYIFNKYNGENPFAQIVKQAQTEGYTEPDPRVDLEGLDVMRKILILSREAGYEKELEDVQFNGFLPSNTMHANSVDEFFQLLEKEESWFEQLYSKAKATSSKLKMVAVMENGEMSVSLREVDFESPFYHLDEKDNIVALYTRRYGNQPLIVKGAGAGAEVTASGVFADLMYLVNKK